ncbi:hypothetical protein [Evansella tamaricis]|uniref:Uncharacterized protein n=1 Tax=Evansella tamaricis TaxID=2069301 RepID=A0ABS6JAF2_9BACI|nr:hypothetical protein [Evansella tamaricis]MBU9710657.1 hypothetical protein [Evansella tamaricis]
MNNKIRMRITDILLVIRRLKIIDSSFNWLFTDLKVVKEMNLLSELGLSVNVHLYRILNFLIIQCVIFDGIWDGACKVVRTVTVGVPFVRNMVGKEW